MAAKEQLVEEAEDVVARRVDVHPDLVDDDRLLPHQVLAAEQGPEDEVGHDLQRPGCRLGRDARGVDRQFAIGGRVHAAAAALDRLRQPARLRVATRALEDEVLEEVREPGMGLVFATRSDAHEEAHRHGPGGRHRLGHHPEAIREDAPLPGDARPRADASGGDAGRHLRPPRRRRSPRAT
jgi:hypothetical protein